MATRVTTGALPNLIVIGAMKCGTTSLHHYLDVHPEVQMSSPKELKYFASDLNWSLGIDWYRGHFDPDAAVRGESSPQYTTYPVRTGVAELMSDVVPDAKLIYMVRDPIDRMVSHYLHMRAWGDESRELADALREIPHYADRSRYWKQLEPFLAHYPPESILVLSAEELAGERRETLRRVFAYLEVDEDFDSPQFDRLWETSRGKDSKFRLLLRTRKWPVIRNSHRLPRNARWALERIKYSTIAGGLERPEVAPDLRRELEDRLQADADRIREFAGREFAGWSV